MKTQQQTKHIILYIDNKSFLLHMKQSFHRTKHFHITRSRRNQGVTQDRAYNPCCLKRVVKEKHLYMRNIY